MAQRTHPQRSVPSEKVQRGNRYRRTRISDRITIRRAIRSNLAISVEYLAVRYAADCDRHRSPTRFRQIIYMYSDRNLKKIGIHAAFFYADHACPPNTANYRAMLGKQ